jgi:hypothetical protein
MSVPEPLSADQIADRLAALPGWRREGARLATPT